MVEGFYGTVIVFIVFAFVTNIVRMSFRHHENMKRIEHGYPTITGEKPEKSDYVDLSKERMQ